MQFYTGIDLGNRSIDIFVMDEMGSRKTVAKAEPNIPSLLKSIEKFGKDQKIVFETSSTYYWLSDGLKKAGYQDLTMAHALKIAHITKAKVKTDRRDSQALADLHRLNFIPESYIYPMEMREARDLARRRMTLVKKRSSDFVNLKLLLRRHGFQPVDRNQIETLSEEDLAEFRGHDMHLDHAMDDTLEFNRMYTKSIKRIEDSLEDVLEGDSVTNLLQGIPGVGKWLSKYLRLEIESVERFKNHNHFSSWCRVTPGVAQSGNKQTRGRGSKQGNSHVKYALMQAATVAIRVNPQIKAYYTAHVERRRGSSGKMVSMNIIAHKLCFAVWHCFHGRAFDVNKLFNLDHLLGEDQ